MIGKQIIPRPFWVIIENKHWTLKLQMAGKFPSLLKGGSHGSVSSWTRGARHTRPGQRPKLQSFVGYIVETQMLAVCQLASAASEDASATLRGSLKSSRLLLNNAFG